MFIRCVAAIAMVCLTMNLHSQSIAPFNEVLGLMKSDYSKAQDLMEKAQFVLSKTNQVQDCQSIEYLKNAESEDEISIRLMVCEDQVLSIMISCNVEQVIELEDGARSNQDLAMQYGNIGNESAVVFTREDGVEVFTRKDVFYQLAHMMISTEPRFDFFKSSMEAKDNFDPEKDVVLKMLELVSVENSKGMTVEQYLEEIGPVATPFNTDFKVILQEFRSSEQAEGLRQKINVEFLQDSEYVERSGTVMKEIFALYTERTVLDGNPEMKMGQFLMDRRMMGSICMFGYVFKSHPIAAELGR